MDEQTEIAEMEAFWGGTLTDVKEIKQVIPPTQNVKLSVASIDIFAKDKEEAARNWRFLNVKFRIEDGIEVQGERRYKGALITQMIVYFANPGSYDYKKPFFAKGQFLVPISQLVKATGIDTPKMVFGGLTDETIAMIAEQLKGKQLIGNITQKKEEKLSADSGKYEETGSMVNEVKGFKKLPDSALVQFPRGVVIHLSPQIRRQRNGSL